MVAHTWWHLSLRCWVGLLGKAPLRHLGTARLNAPQRQGPLGFLQYCPARAPRAGFIRVRHVTNTLGVHEQEIARNDGSC